MGTPLGRSAAAEAGAGAGAGVGVGAGAGARSDRRAAATVWPRVVLVLALGAAIVMWARLQRVVPYLGHDESVYAARARSWLIDAPASGWAAYRPIGLPALGRVALGLTGTPSTVSETATAAATATLRVVGLLLALLTLVIVYLVGARLFGAARDPARDRARGAVAVLVVLGGTTFVRRLPEFLDDLCAAGLLLLVAYLVLRSRRTGVTGARWSLPAAAVVMVAAFLVRYGAASGGLAIAVAGLVAWGPRVWLRAWREVLAAAAVVMVGLVPLIIHSARVTGSPLGIWLQGAQVARQRYPGEALIYYAQVFPRALTGRLGAVVMVAGLVGVLAAGRRLWLSRRGRRPARAGAAPAAADQAGIGAADQAGIGAGGQSGIGAGGQSGGGAAPAAADRERVFLGVAAVLSVLLLGLIAHGEDRYVLFAVFALTLLGTDALVTALDRFMPAALPAVVVLAVAAAVVVPVTAADTATKISSLGPIRASLNDVAAEVMSDRAGRDCLVIAQFAPEAGWLAGCTARHPKYLHGLPADGVVYVIDFPGAPHAPSLARVRALGPGRSWTVRKVRTTGRYRVAVLAISSPTPPQPPSATLPSYFGMNSPENVAPGSRVKARP